jgi:ATP-dependent helicase/nuclease subunit A
VTKKFCDNNPAVGRMLESEARRVLPLIERRRALVARDRTEALLYIATAAAAN